MQENKWYILKEDKEERKLKINIYQIFTRLFGNKVQANIPYGTIEENGVGKFNDITEKALQEIKALGISHVWYTGIIEHALLTDYTAYDIPMDDADVVKGRAGSPYAIKDYYDVNPDLAVEVDKRMQEFEYLLRRTHEQQLKVIIDFVPNHVARYYKSDVKPENIEDLGEGDNKSISFDPNNNFYYLVGHKFEVPKDYKPLGKLPFIHKDGFFNEDPAKATGNDLFTHQPCVNDWFETVKLNYGKNYHFNTQHYSPIPATWLKMREILMYWAGKKIDGFRCDMAEMVPVEFWQWVIPEIKKYSPEIIFIAEIYNPQQYHNYIYQGKFDFLYDKVQLYDTLRNIITKKDTPDNLKNTWQFLRGINKHMLRFLENHDEQRIASSQFCGDPFKALPAFAVSALLFTGPVMIYFGQEVGEESGGDAGFSGDDGRTTIFDYWGVGQHQKWMNNAKFDGGGLRDDQVVLRDFYKAILNLKLKYPAFYEGDFLDLHTLNRNFNKEDYSTDIYSFIRFFEYEKILVLTNFNHEGKAIKLSLPTEALEVLKIAPDKKYMFKTLFSFGKQNTEMTQEIIFNRQQPFLLDIYLDKYEVHIIQILEV